jgi:hypothetical protein
MLIFVCTIPFFFHVDIISSAIRMPWEFVQSCEWWTHVLGHLFLTLFSDLVKWIKWYVKRLFSCSTEYFSQGTPFSFFFLEIYERSIFFYSLLRNILVNDSRLSWLRQGWMWLSKTYAVDKTFRKPRKKVQLRNQIVLFSESIRSLNYCNFGRLIFLKIWSIFFARKIWSVLTVSGYC